MIESNTIKIKRHAWSLIKWNCKKFFLPFACEMMALSSCSLTEMKLYLLAIILCSKWTVKYFCNNNLSIHCLSPSLLSHDSLCVWVCFSIFFPAKKNPKTLQWTRDSIIFFCELNSLNLLQRTIIYIRARMHTHTYTMMRWASFENWNWRKQKWPRRRRKKINTLKLGIIVVISQQLSGGSFSK